MPEQPCPHVSPAMVAAGFTRCAVCETAPTAPAGFFDEDTSRQEAALSAARAQLTEALYALASEADDAARASKRKRVPTDLLDRTRAAIRDLDIAESAVDTAAYDLTTAKGAHG